jgi:ketosteroid isomerase-like protein
MSLILLLINWIRNGGGFSIDRYVRPGHFVPNGIVLCYFISIMKTTILTAFVLLLLFGVTVAQSDNKKTKISGEIRKVLDEQVSAWNRGDIEAFMTGYWKSEKMVFISGNNVSRGWQAALDRYKKGYDTKEKMGTLSFSELEIEVLSKKSALVIGRFTLVRKKDKPTGMFTLTFRKIKGDWRIIVDHTS